MAGYILSLEKQAPIGDGYDIAMGNMDMCKVQIMELKALLNYKRDNIIKLNKNRAISDINYVIGTMEELKKIINKIK